jgi:hypothetical protein
MNLPEVFVARSEADYYEPVVRGLLAPDIREPAEGLLQNLLVVLKRLNGCRKASRIYPAKVRFCL